MKLQRGRPCRALGHQDQTRQTLYWLQTVCNHRTLCTGEESQILDPLGSVWGEGEGGGLGAREIKKNVGE